MNSPRKIVITGLGAVCGAGRTVDEIFGAIVNGRSAIAPITQLDASRWPVRVAAECNVENKILVPDRKLHKSISRTDIFGIYAAESAIQQSGLSAHREMLDAAAEIQFDDRSGIFAGSGGGNYGCNYDFFQAMAAAKGDLKKFGGHFAESVNPMWLLRNLPNNVLCHVGIRHNFKGANACITNHCVGGAMAVAEAAAAIRACEADRAVAVGHDTPFEPETLFHYQWLGLMSPEMVRPFDRDRSGTVFGEGAASVMLETAEDAEARGGKIFGEFLGSGCATEATGVLDIRPDGDGLSRAIQLALADAGISPGAVGMIIAHGNGTHASDASEACAIRRVFGEKIPPVTGFKWACGHLIAASGILDLVFALTSLSQKIVPGIATLNLTDPEFAPFPVSKNPQQPRSDIALVLCRGFGGMNVALLVRANP
ncbi:MAG TPA: beta-ketoacyl synthase N-terminal-like domain-containing protein [Verrucomicrobiae bacterium]